jgi:hypothetical protein
VNFVTSEVEAEEEVEVEDEQYVEQEVATALPSTTEYDHTELLVDPTTTIKPSIVPVPYPKSARKLRSLSYGTIGPVPKKLSRELRGLQKKHPNCIHQQTSKVRCPG